MVIYHLLVGTSSNIRTGPGMLSHTSAALEGSVIVSFSVELGGLNALKLGEAQMNLQTLKLC